MFKRRPAAAPADASIIADRRAVLFGLPAAGAALFAVGRSHAPAVPDTMPSASKPGQPVYRETDLMRRYYKLARF